MIFRNRAYEELLEAEVARLREENERLFGMLLRAHGMAIEPPKFVPNADKPLPGVAKETVNKARKAPWAIQAKRIEEKVSRMPREEVLKKLGDADSFSAT